MTNRFQKHLLQPENRHIIWKIMKLYHPDLNETWVSKSGKTHNVLDWTDVFAKYNWVTITFKHIVDIGVKFIVPFSGRGWKIDDFERTAGNSKFKAWRFISDSKYEEPAWDAESREFITSANPDINPLFEELEIPRPTAHEMMKFYYSD
jgi:hypothetical protein